MSNQGIGLPGILLVVFITLKLVGAIDWSWWWVTAPFWGGFALFLALGGLALVGAIVVAPWPTRRTKR